MQQMTIPDFGLVVLIGPSGAGKTTFGRKHFRESEILSSDEYRPVVGDDDRSSRTTAAAFDVMAYIARKRLEARRMAVIDATNLHASRWSATGEATPGRSTSSATCTAAGRNSKTCSRPWVPDRLRRGRGRWDPVPGDPAGGVWGGPLTALRYPEREIVRVPARETYQTPAPKAMLAAPTEGPDGQQAADQELDLTELQGVLRINTRLERTVTVKPENSAAALEMMSRFAVAPRWLIYMPPTMAPCRAAPEGELLERPAEAFEHYRKRGVKVVTCQNKHMGSHGIVVVTENDDVARRRFGTAAGSPGCIYTRTGRRFFRRSGDSRRPCSAGSARRSRRAASGRPSRRTAHASTARSCPGTPRAPG